MANNKDPDGTAPLVVFWSWFILLAPACPNSRLFSFVIVSKCDGLSWYHDFIYADMV